MIIPIRCFTCNKVIASIYPEYKRRLAAIESKIKDGDEVDAGGETGVDASESTMLDKIELFKELGITRYCCKRHLVSNVDLIDIV